MFVTHRHRASALLMIALAVVAPLAGAAQTPPPALRGSPTRCRAPSAIARPGRATEIGLETAAARLPAAHPPPQCGRLAEVHQPALPQRSPYLLQHAHNPVDWYPWGDEAFADGATARTAGAALASATPPATGATSWRRSRSRTRRSPRYLNEHYVAIKVDREERPDVDADLHERGAGADRRRRLADDGLAHRRSASRSSAAPTSRRATATRGARTGFLTVLHDARATPTPTQPDARRRGGGRARRERFAASLAPRAPRRRRCPDAAVLHAAAAQLSARLRRRARRLRRRAEVPEQPADPLPAALPPPHRRRATRCAMATHDARADGGRRHPRPGRRRLPPLLDRRALAGAALREDALRQRAARASPTSRPTRSPAAPDFARRRARHPRLRRARDDRARGRLLLRHRRRQPDADGRREEGRFFTWTPAEIAAVLGAERGAPRRAPTTASRPAGNFEGRSILHVAAAARRGGARARP